MSEQRRATTEFVRVCDLCGKAVDTYGHRDWSAMNVGHPKAPTNVPEKSLFRFFRKGTGRESGAPKGDYRSWEWDFHGECLVAALMPLVTDEARKETELC